MRMDLPTAELADQIRHAGYFIQPVRAMRVRYSQARFACLGRTHLDSTVDYADECKTCKETNCPREKKEGIGCDQHVADVKHYTDPTSHHHLGQHVNN